MEVSFTDAAVFCFFKRHQARTIQVMRRTLPPIAIPAMAPVPSTITAAAVADADVDADAIDEMLEGSVDDVVDATDVEDVGFAEDEEASWQS